MDIQILLSQIWGVMAKDVRQWSRDRQALFAPLLLPIVLMIFCAIMFGYGGDEWNIGLVVEGDGPETQQMTHAIENLQSNISPYFRIITRDATIAEQLSKSGRLQMVITIPSDFDARILAGETPIIQTQVFNLNTDMTKNVRLRLERAIEDYLATEGRSTVTIEQFTTLDEDVWRRAFIAGGAVVLSLILGSSLNTAIIVAREWERNTVKEVRLAPSSLTAIVTGKLIAGLVATAINVSVTIFVAVLLFGLRIPPDRWFALLIIGIGIAVATAGFGLAVGAALRDYRTLQPLLGVALAGSFFASGGYASIATLPPAAREFNRFWLPAYVFESMHNIMHQTIPPDIMGLIPLVLTAALIGVCLGWWSLHRSLVSE